MKMHKNCCELCQTHMDSWLQVMTFLSAVVVIIILQLLLRDLKCSTNSRTVFNKITFVSILQSCGFFTLSKIVWVDIAQYVYYKLKAVCLSVHHANNSSRTAIVLTHQAPNIKQISFAYFKFITMNKCGAKLLLCSGLKASIGLGR